MSWMGLLGKKKTFFPELSHLHNLPMGIMGNGVFFVVEREVLKAPPAAMDAFDEEKHHAVITLSLRTAFEY